MSKSLTLTVDGESVTEGSLKRALCVDKLIWAIEDWRSKAKWTVRKADEPISSEELLSDFFRTLEDHGVLWMLDCDN